LSAVQSCHNLFNDGSAQFLSTNYHHHCTITRDGHETWMAETETLASPAETETFKFWDETETFAGLETWPRRWNARCHAV